MRTHRFDFVLGSFVPGVNARPHLQQSSKTKVRQSFQNQQENEFGHLPFPDRAETCCPLVQLRKCDAHTTETRRCGRQSALKFQWPSLRLGPTHRNSKPCFETAKKRHGSLQKMLKQNVNDLCCSEEIMTFSLEQIRTKNGSVSLPFRCFGPMLVLPFGHRVRQQIVAEDDNDGGRQHIVTDDDNQGSCRVNHFFVRET